MLFYIIMIKIGAERHTHTPVFAGKVHGKIIVAFMSRLVCIFAAWIESGWHFVVTIKLFI